MNDQLKQLQLEVGEWSRRNFPNNKPHHPLLGMVEEWGELSSSKTQEDLDDSIADIAIYLADYCERNSLVMSLDTAPASMPIALSRLCHLHLKGEQGIRYTPDQIQTGKQKYVSEILATLVYGAEVGMCDFWPTVEGVWSKVKQRDWQKNPIHAATIAQSKLP